MRRWGRTGTRGFTWIRRSGPMFKNMLLRPYPTMGKNAVTAGCRHEGSGGQSNGAIFEWSTGRLGAGSRGWYSACIQRDQMSESTLNASVARHWRFAFITLEEDQRLSMRLRSQLFTR
jgi:hypothetical protein